ncbi:O-methyltransferase [Flavobacterium sp.]|uniref:O-methyltransferase n=1 Tax=Flavobacterium sp. TaxID=239 RepID=UPI00391C0645
MNQILAYIHFLWHSKNEHGVHSPFVFDLVTQCFYDKKKYPAYEKLASYRTQLLANSNTIEVTDFGAGSRVFTSNTRAINAIAKNAGISLKRAQLLFRLVQYFQPQSLLEIGTSLGLATAALHLGNPKAKITTLEGCRNTHTVAQSELQKWQPTTRSIEFITTEFSEALSNLQTTSSFDLIYFDGNHSKAATLAYFEQLVPTATNDSVWIFDDIHWSKDMEEAWENIKNHPAVTVTIDTFQWGLVFFRNEQRLAKEHFIVRV